MAATFHTDGRALSALQLIETGETHECIGADVQACGVDVLLALRTRAVAAVGDEPGAALQALGTAMVYPTLLAAITDHTHPTSRATSLGVYRFWRDLGYAVGALLSGFIADLVGLGAAIHRVGGLAFLSGIVVMYAMAERRTLPITALA